VDVSATRLLVLGVVRIFGKAHGYQVRRELLTWSADKWANVQPGSIYHALKKMAAENLLEQVDIEPGQPGPDRTAYRLTPEGEAQFFLLLEQSLADPTGPGPAMSAAITLMTTLPRKRVISLLRYQLVKREGEQRSARHMAEKEDDWGQPPHVRELFRLWQAHTEANLDWLRALVARLEAGEYVMADDEGRAFGEPPE
jgi:DNA-binding PadR family transcriptional regulator